MKEKRNYRGITHIISNLPGKLFDIALSFWKRFLCKRNMHLFDEVWSPEEHTLYCDACGLTVHIEKIEEE